MVNKDKYLNISQYKIIILAIEFTYQLIFQIDFKENYNSLAICNFTFNILVSNLIALTIININIIHLLDYWLDFINFDEFPLISEYILNKLLCMKIKN